MTMTIVNFRSCEKWATAIEYRLEALIGVAIATALNDIDITISTTLESNSALITSESEK